MPLSCALVRNQGVRELLSRELRADTVSLSEQAFFGAVRTEGPLEGFRLSSPPSLLPRPSVSGF